MVSGAPLPLIVNCICQRDCLFTAEAIDNASIVAAISICQPRSECRDVAQALLALDVDADVRTVEGNHKFSCAANPESLDDVCAHLLCGSGG